MNNKIKNGKLTVCLFFAANAYNSYGKVDQVIGTSLAGDTDKGLITRDLTTSFVVLLAIYFPSITGESWYMYSPLPSLCCWPSISPRSLVRVGICIHHFLHCAAGHLFPLAHWLELVYVFTTSIIVLLAIYFPSLTGESWYICIHHLLHCAAGHLFPLAHW